MKFKPNVDRVLLKEYEEPIDEHQGIIVVPNGTNKQKVYKVIDKGPECSHELNIGDKVLCTKYIDGGFRYQGESYYLTKEINILAVISD